ncbi:MAG: hypothetical protein KC561_06990, partial [Myxococcales bacterium]|nr:hypothetical protein [Myxococcales bacterium]
SEETINLLGWRIADDDELAGSVALPDVILEPGQSVVFFADNQPGQGELHLPFGLSAGGEMVTLWSPRSEVVDQQSFPKSESNDAFARFPDGQGTLTRCRWASAGLPNGSSCEPVERSGPSSEPFLPYDWPPAWGEPTGPLVLNELALRPDGSGERFVEVYNSSQTDLSLASFRLTLAPLAPSDPLPGPLAGTNPPWPQETLAPGAHLQVPITSEQIGQISATEAFEGSVMLWRNGDSLPLDELQFMYWPVGAQLARQPDATGYAVFCSEASPGAANASCAPLQSRPIGDRLHAIRTPGDFEALAEGGTSVDSQAVKFVIDYGHGGTVHLLRSVEWDLHYTFIRNQVWLQTPLDRCDPAQDSMFNAGWRAFSREEYYCGYAAPAADYECLDSERDFMLGTLVFHPGTGLQTVEFATGDRLSSTQMRRTFFDLMARLPNPTDWALRPQSDPHTDRIRAIEGTVPAVPTDAPFEGIVVQPMNPGVAYGRLAFVPADELDDAAVGYQTIVITDDVPLDIPLLAGLITELPQTPLSHVNILSRNRGTPNLSLRDARNDSRLEPLIGELVRFEVLPSGFTIRAATPEEVDQNGHPGPGPDDVLEPRIDLERHGILQVSDVSLEDLPSVGAKAAQLGELANIDWTGTGACVGRSFAETPSNGIVVPVAYYAEHFEASGAAARLAELRDSAEFRSDPEVRSEGLEEVRDLIGSYPVDDALIEALEDEILSRFGGARLRFRSSSNTEDLPGFSGAGLYQSTSAAVGDPDLAIDDALRDVWASLWFLRAYDEREYFYVDQDLVAMAVLIHPAYLSESANGVGISRNILDGTRGDIYYMNVQLGEASVANPAPGITTEQFLYRWGRDPRVAHLGYSSFSPSQAILDDARAEHVACALRTIHNHFRPLLGADDQWFAMDIEFKFVGDDGQDLVVKQARPYSFGNAEVPADCREF